MKKVILILLIAISIINAEVKKSFYKTGELRAEEEINKTGKRDGKRTYYYKSGKVGAIQNYKNGKKNGESIAYYESGKVKEKEILADDGSGSQKRFYEDGTLKSEFTAEAGMKNIIKKAYYQNGKLKSSKSSAIKKEYFKNGILKSEVFLKNGRRTGNEKEYYENEKLKREKSKDNCGDGFSREYSRKGVLTREWKQINGCKARAVIIITNFYPSGQMKLKKESYKDRRGQSIEQAYYSNGKREYKMNFNENQPEGAQYFYNKQGKLTTIDYFTNGVKTKATYYEGGQQAFTLFFRDGMIQSGVYYQNGRENKISPSEISKMNRQKRH